MTYYIKKIKHVSTASTVALTTALLAFGVLNQTAQAQKSSPAFNWNYATDANQVDKALSDADIQIKYDGLDVTTQLNVTANNGAVSIVRNAPATFKTFWNYGHFIERSEIRIFDVTSSVQSTPVMVLPVGANQTAALTNMEVLPDDVIYVLRVYDDKGRFDETEAKLLRLVENNNIDRVETINESSEIGYSIDRTAVRNIRVKGASVTVYGENISPTGLVTVDGVSVPTDLEGKFVRQMILPFGDQKIDVEVLSLIHI